MPGRTGTWDWTVHAVICLDPTNLDFVRPRSWLGKLFLAAAVDLPSPFQTPPSHQLVNNKVYLPPTTETAHFPAVPAVPPLHHDCQRSTTSLADHPVDLTWILATQAPTRYLNNTVRLFTVVPPVA